LYFRWIAQANLPADQQTQAQFPGIPLDEFGQVENLFDVNVWVYELIEEERATRRRTRRRQAGADFLDDEAGEAGDDEDDEEDNGDDEEDPGSYEENDEEEMEAGEQLERRQKVQTAVLIRKPSPEDQAKNNRLKVYVNRFVCLFVNYYYINIVA
jgi:hypothetical protein